MNALVVDQPVVHVTAVPDRLAIKREAELRLQHSGYLALNDVTCDAHGGDLYLRGRLPSYYLKQIAQAVAAEVEGVRRVLNRIEVIAPAPPAPVGFDHAVPDRDGVS